MTLQDDLAARFGTFLREEKNFPAESILHEPQVGDDGRPDMMLMNPSTEEVLAVVEIKDEKESFDDVAARVDGYLATLRDPAVEAFGLQLADDPGVSPRFEIWRRGEDGLFRPVLAESFPDFHGLSAKKVAIELARLREQREATSDEFKKVCFVLAPVALLIVVIDALVAAATGFELLTTPRLPLLAIAIGLVVAPYLQKFKAAGIEIERRAPHR